MESNPQSSTLNLESWKVGKRPNYTTNQDKLFPYSEVPHLGEYHLVKIPFSLDNMIEHVDYWGEGRVETEAGTKGFTNCYNVNHSYQLVSSGSDIGRKIPNRIPILNSTSCDTRAYVLNGTVLMVTVMGGPINACSARDISRLTNKMDGKVIAYGYKPDSEDIINLTEHLSHKDIFIWPRYTLPKNLEPVTLYSDYLTFLGTNLLKGEIYRSVKTGAFAPAVSVSKQMESEDTGYVIGEIVQELLKGSYMDNSNLLSFGYQLWINGGEDVVRNQFPPAFKLIYAQDNVKIVNKGYNQALKLKNAVEEDNSRVALGDDHIAKNSRLNWHFKPVWLDSGNGVIFKLYNVAREMYLRSGDEQDTLGDRDVYGSPDSDTDKFRYIVEPFTKNGDLAFYIINYEYRQGLKLGVSQDSDGDRTVYGHNGDLRAGDEDRFKWIVTEWKASAAPEKGAEKAA